MNLSHCRLNRLRSEGDGAHLAFELDQAPLCGNTEVELQSFDCESQAFLEITYKVLQLGEGAGLEGVQGPLKLRRHVLPDTAWRFMSPKLLELSLQIGDALFAGLQTFLHSLGSMTKSETRIHMTHTF